MAATVIKIFDNHSNQNSQTAKATTMIIGIDDTDSRSDGGCTTYIAAVLVEKLKKYGDLTDYPLLIRLNPNIRYKTRGNGAVALNIEMDEASEADEVKEVVLDEVREQAKLSDENTNPGVVFLDDARPDLRNDLGLDLGLFARCAMQDILRIADAKDLLNRYDIDSCGFKNGRGLIGALAAAAVASNGIPDHTFELIAYRTPSHVGTPRVVDAESVWDADARTYPRTWDTVDRANKKVVCVPRGRDPVLFGIRGDADAVIDAADRIRSELIERSVLFRTNQGTDMHLVRSTIDRTRGGRSYILRGVVSSAPRTIQGGHVIFRITDPQSGSTIDCAAFEPTKNFRGIIRQLTVGDRVVVCGSVDAGTVHLEKIRIEHLAAVYETRNPVCACGRRMKSAGAGQGYRCKRCGTASLVLDHMPVKRGLDCGWYEVPPSARRHIAKPLVRCVGVTRPVHPSR